METSDAKGNSAQDEITGTQSETGFVSEEDFGLQKNARRKGLLRALFNIRYHPLNSCFFRAKIKCIVLNRSQKLILAGKAQSRASQSSEELSLCLLMVKILWGQPLQVGPTLQEVPGLRHFPAQQSWNGPSFARAKSHPWRWQLSPACRGNLPRGAGLGVSPCWDCREMRSALGKSCHLKML